MPEIHVFLSSDRITTPKNNDESITIVIINSVV